jgi:hypothetical protein
VPVRSACGFRRTRAASSCRIRRPDAHSPGSDDGPVDPITDGTLRALQAPRASGL